MNPVSDIVRWIYNCLYRWNIECDILSPDTKDFSPYEFIAVPALYSKFHSHYEESASANT